MLFLTIFIAKRLTILIYMQLYPECKNKQILGDFFSSPWIPLLQERDFQKKNATDGYP